jgi:hypothetical protein
VAAAALSRSIRANKRSQEAVIVVREVWNGYAGIDSRRTPRSSGGEDGRYDPNPFPREPNQRLTLDVTREVGSSLVLRAARTSDGGEPDRETVQSHYALLEVLNSQQRRPKCASLARSRVSSGSMRGSAQRKGAFRAKSLISTSCRRTRRSMFQYLTLGHFDYSHIHAVTAAKKQPLRLAPVEPIVL